MNEHSQSEIIGIALQRIGSILEADEHAHVSYNEERDVRFDHNGRNFHEGTTSITLEVAGDDQ